MLKLSVNRKFRFSRLKGNPAGQENSISEWFGEPDSETFGLRLTARNQPADLSEHYCNAMEIRTRNKLKVLELDSATGVPLHRQAEIHLRSLINGQEFQDGALLPNELTLANEFGVSRGTVRAALSRMVQDGILDRRAGVGTRVRPRKVESGVTAWRSLTREMAGKGVIVENFALETSRVAASKIVAQALRIDAKATVFRLDRLRGWDGMPVLHSRSWFHPRLALKGTEDFSQPIYEVLKVASGTSPHHAREEFSAVASNAQLAKQLQVKIGEPLLLRRHTVYDDGDRPVEVAEVHYVSSRFQLTLDLKRDLP